MDAYNKETLNKFKKYSFLFTCLPAIFFISLRFLSLPTWIPLFISLVFPNWGKEKKKNIKTQLTDGYIFFRIIFEFILFKNFFSWAPVTIRFFAIYIILDIIQANVNISIFAELYRKPTSDENDADVVSFLRIVILMTIGYLELMICFGLIYITYPESLFCVNNKSIITDSKDKLYFSVITQLTIGYGEIIPLKKGKIIAIIQGIISLLFVLLILSRLINFLPMLKEEREDFDSITSRHIIPYAYKKKEPRRKKRRRKTTVRKISLFHTKKEALKK